MANLPDEINNTVFNLQRRLLELINQATVVGFAILEQYGENETTIITFEQLQNVRERARNYYTRLYRLLLQIAENPVTNDFTLNLLNQSILETQAIADAGQATIEEAKRDFELL